MALFASLTPLKNLSKIFEFHYQVNNIKDGNEAQRTQKKALFITLTGQATLEILCQNFRR